ncbi:hypothetical protein OA105_01940 [Prochlorococcus sp. AH-736-B08]|nr:hypothetical protein [Prochlorococcus sp. AH-736-B08]
MKKPAISGPYLNDSILITYRSFGIKSSELHPKFKQKIIARIIERIWYIRLQKAKQHKLAYSCETTIQKMESIYKQWRLKSGV